jgi:Holliday junction resolvase RusA-like endonuclease
MFGNMWSMTAGIAFFVPGHPVPKQSFVYDGHGHGHTKPEAKAWQDMVMVRCRESMNMCTPAFEMMTGHVSLQLGFVLPDKRRRDCVNLAKSVEDAMNGLLYKDDSQVIKLEITKKYIGEPGVQVIAIPLETT